MTDQYSNSGTNSVSRDETLSNIWGGGSDSCSPRGNIVGMQTSWSEGSWNTTPAPGPVDQGGFTARTEAGRPLGLSEITSESIVKIHGQEMSASAAEHLGFLVRDPSSGLLRVAGANNGHSDGPDQDRQREEQQNDGDAPAALDDHSEAIMSDAFEAAPGETLSAANDIMDTGEVSDHNLAQLASRLGVEPGEIAARVEHARAAYAHEAATAAARRVGVSLATAVAALAYARANDHGELKQAAEQHLHSGQPRYDKFVQDYVERLDTIDPNYILTSLRGKARWDVGTGEIVVKAGRYGEMGWGAAVRAGLIKL